MPQPANFYQRHCWIPFR